MRSSKKEAKTSPEASVSESNVVAPTEPNNNALLSLKFDLADIEVEVQSPDNSIWDSLFADQIDGGGGDFMISSPRRDHIMVSSPKRDFMVSSPRREYMISSPKREYFGASPKRGGGTMSSFFGQGWQQSQSPLHKASSSTSVSSPKFHHGAGGESLALPTIDAYFGEYNRESYGGGYGAMKGTASDECLPVGSFGASSSSAEVPNLLECLSMQSSRFCPPVGEGQQMNSGERDLYHDQMNHHFDAGLLHHEQQGGGEEEQGLLAAKLEMGLVDHGMLGHMLSLESEQEQDTGLQLVHLLLACAEAVAKDDYLSARRYLHHLNRVVSPLGDSMQRVAAFFADALAARLASSSSSTSPSMSKQLAAAFPPPTSDVLKVYQILYQACPYIKFAHFTANQAIFEAFESEDRVHVIDLDILQGYQWPAFLQALAARPGGSPFLRLTGVGFPEESVRETGRHLAELARSLRVPFEFHAVGERRLEDLRPHMLCRRVGEALAVNSVCRLHRVAPGQIGALVGMIRDQAPNIVTLVEQEASHNGPHFLGRFLEALHYYSAIFDSLDATFPADSAGRARVEQYIFAPEIGNIVACEGAERVERHERVERWRRVMEGKGFKGVPLSANAVTQSQILLGLYACDGYRLNEDKGCLLLGWQDRPLIAASAWRC